MRKTQRVRGAAESCDVLETVSFVDDKPGCSPHCRCHGVPDTERYKRGRRGRNACVNVNLC